MSTNWIRVTFGPVLALLAAFTAIFGILMVAPGPERPGDPGITLRQLSNDDERTQTQQVKQIDDFYTDAASFRDEYPGWQRNIFLAGAGLGLLFALIGLALPATVNYLRWGLLLSAVVVFVWAYSTATADVPRVTPSGSNLFSLVGAGSADQLDFAGRFARFAVSFIGLILVLFLGIWRLTEWAPPARKLAPAAAPAAASPPAAWAPAPTPAPAAASPTADSPAGSVATLAAPAPAAEPTSEWRRPDA